MILFDYKDRVLAAAAVIMTVGTLLMLGASAGIYYERSKLQARVDAEVDAAVGEAVAELRALGTGRRCIIIQKVEKKCGLDI